MATRATTSRAIHVVALAASAALACSLFVPETRDRIAIATAEERAWCRDFEVDPAIVGPEIVDAVEPYYSVAPSRNGRDYHLLGAKLHVRPMRGMTTELLGRTLRCHAAREVLSNAGATTDPYVVPDGWVKIEVESEDAGFVVRVSSHDHPTAKTILARARSFVASRAGVPR